MEGNKELFSETSDNQLLVDMLLHPSPLEEVDPLSFEIKKEDMKQEIDRRFDDCIKQYPNIVIKEEVDLDDVHDSSYEVMPTKYNGCEDQKDLEQCTSGVISEQSSTLIVNDDTYICSVWEKNVDVVKHIIACNYKCDECNETFSHKLEILTHFERVHGKYEKIIDLNGFVVDTGVKCSNSNTQMNNQYKFGLCKQSFFQIKRVEKHERIHTGNKLHKCNICGKSFPTSSSVHVHEKIHTGIKPYKCSFCGKSFLQFSHLKVHERIHTGHKPYKCSFCAKLFYSSSALKKHERIHTSSKRFKCSFCGKSFFQLSNLKVHERIHTGHKPYKCSFCAKSFAQSSSLKIHEAIHTESKRFMCSYCGKIVSQSSDLHRHERTHTSNKPYKCSFCEKLFSCLSSVKRHELIHGRRKPITIFL